MLTSAELRIRDPYIVSFEGIYYLFGTPMPDAFENCCFDPHALYCYTGTDLVHWDGPHCCFTIPDDGDYWGKQDLWAPEVHYYNGRFYLFVSIMGKNGLRGTQIAVSDIPAGPYRIIANRPATPLGQSCIDGTLFVDNAEPYILYSHDWPDNYIADGDYYDGEICAQQLSDDLTTPVGEPFVMFASSETPLSAGAPAENFWEGKMVRRYGTDGPFVTRLSDGRLFLIWSPIPKNNYIVCCATSDRIRGEWKHLDKPLYDQNGGHGMFFTGFDGQRRLCIHYPEHEPDERMLLLNIEERDGVIRIC